ncbi:MAG: YceI family protein, partial [Pseudomonadota bacterium]
MTYSFATLKPFAISLALALALPFAGVIDTAQAQQVALSALPAGKYKMDLSHSSLLWKVNHLGLSMYTARFTDFDTDLMLNSKDPAKSDMTVTVKAASVKTDYPGKRDWDGELANDPKFFNSKEYPDITFTAKSMDVTGENTGKVMGDLTFLGNTGPVTLDVVFTGAMAAHPFSKKPVMGFTATTSFKR